MRIPRRTAEELLDPWTVPLVLCTDGVPTSDSGRAYRMSLNSRQKLLKQALDYIVEILNDRLVTEDFLLKVT